MIYSLLIEDISNLEVLFHRPLDMLRIDCQRFTGSRFSFPL
jgi:hypothetical protein